MPGLNFAPAFSFLTALSAAPLRPLHTLVRTTEARFRPSRLAAHRPAGGRALAEALARTGAGPHHCATVLREPGAGGVPTIVLGGFVPDAPDQVFLLRRFLLRAGDVYYVNYPRHGFSPEVLAAQLADLTEELAAAGKPPVVFAVSFGAGLVLDWLRRARLAGNAVQIAGLVLVSPVTCMADLIAPGTAKPATLLGRAIQPFIAGDAAVREKAVDKARAIFTRMFEAGAQNKLALSLLMTKTETAALRASVMGAIHGITADGARERVAALGALPAPTEYFSPVLLPLTAAPVLVLYAEKEETVLDPGAPGRFAFDRAYRAYFPDGRVQTVRAKAGETPVQHASLIFHVFDFLPPLQSFYQRVRLRALPLAA